jgi:hypothetical protein
MAATRYKRPKPPAHGSIHLADLTVPSFRGAIKATRITAGRHVDNAVFRLIY